MTIPGRGWYVTRPREERMVSDLHVLRNHAITAWCESQFGPAGERWIPPYHPMDQTWRFKNTDDLFLFNLVWK